MNLKKFIEKFTSAPVNEKKVAEIVKVYGVELPEDVQHFVSACGENPLFIEDDQVDADFRVLSFDVFSIRPEQLCCPQWIQPHCVAAAVMITLAAGILFSWVPDAQAGDWSPC